MKYDVNIEIKNSQKLEFGENDRITDSSEGIFYIKDNIYYLVYQDYSEGIKGARTTLKIDPTEERVFLLRAEPSGMKQVFCRGEKKEGFYQVDGRKVKLEVETSKLRFDLTKDKGKIEISYILYLMGKKIGENNLEVNYIRKGVE